MFPRSPPEKHKPFSYSAGHAETSQRPGECLSLSSQHPGYASVHLDRKPQNDTVVNNFYLQIHMHLSLLQNCITNS